MEGPKCLTIFYSFDKSFPRHICWVFGYPILGTIEKLEPLPSGAWWEIFRLLGKFMLGDSGTPEPSFFSPGTMNSCLCEILA